MDSSNLLHILNQKVRLFSKELNEQLQEYGLYTAQWSILYTLTQKGPMTQTDIWQYLKVEAPTITRTLVRMEASGWIIRRHGKDKRERIVDLTDMAKEVLPLIKKKHSNYGTTLPYGINRARTTATSLSFRKARTTKE